MTKKEMTQHDAENMLRLLPALSLLLTENPAIIDEFKSGSLSPATEEKILEFIESNETGYYLAPLLGITLAPTQSPIFQECWRAFCHNTDSLYSNGDGQTAYTLETMALELAGYRPDVKPLLVERIKNAGMEGARPGLS